MAKLAIALAPIRKDGIPFVVVEFEILREIMRF